MAILSFLANQLLPLTAALSGITLGIGLAACPMESLALQRAFVILSAVTLAGLIASLVRHNMRRTPYERRVKFEFGIIPLLLFWGFLIVSHAVFGGIRETGPRFMTTSNGKQIGLGVHSHHDEKGVLAADIRNQVGEPMLSWRVSVCPYIEALPLYQQFDLTKPWDGPTNRALVENIPITYRSTLFDETPGNTPWQGFVGLGTAFDPGALLNSARDFPDGTSYTILCVEAHEHVPWSKPADILYGPEIPLPPLGQRYFRNGEWPFCCSVRANPIILACMMDGTVRAITPDIPEARMRALIVRNDGEPSDGWLPDN